MRSIENVASLYNTFQGDLARLRRNVPTRGKNIIGRHRNTIAALERHVKELEAEALSLGYRFDEVK